MRTLSVVIPCFNEQAVISTTHQRMIEVLKDLKSFRHEIIYVNDGSRDQTLSILQKTAETEKNVKIISFSRNFGHQIAISAGLDHAAGDLVVVIDADLQDPPELIPRMIEEIDNGNDIVYGRRQKRAGESRFKIFTAKAFYRIINRLSDVEIPLDTGDFRMMNRAALNHFLSMRESYRFVRGMVAWIGFRQTYIEYNREGRFAGETKYPLSKMVTLAADAILSFSVVPLRMATFLGLATSLVAFLGILYALYLRLFTYNWEVGWTAIMLAILFIGGIILIVLGILGEYIGRIYGEIKKRPLYIIDQIIESSE